MSKMRVSQHSGRAGSAKHNDRSFLVGLSDEERREVAPHIRPEAGQDNQEWRRTGQEDKRPLQEVEIEFYRERYAAALERTNERYRREGHAERCRTPEQLYQGAKTRPEETILQIGDKDAEIDPATFRECVKDYMRQLQEWNKAHGGHMQLLTVALHFDETSPHAHIRRVWDYTDRDGVIRLGQNKALEAAGVPLPEPGKPEGRYNNRKITFDAWARGMWQEVCKAHGYEIETEPVPGRKHKDKAEFIYQQNAERLGRQERAIASNEKGLATLTAQQEQASAAIDNIRGQKLEALRERDAARAGRDVEKALQGLQKALESDFSPEVEILDEAPAKKSLTGKLRPSTVTITREDFDRLRQRSATTQEGAQAAQYIKRALADMKQTAQAANKNKLDLIEDTVATRTQKQADRIDELEKAGYDFLQVHEQVQGWWKEAQAKVEELEPKAQALDQLQEAFPGTMQRLLEIDRLERAHKAGFRLKRDELERYAAFCEKQGFKPQETMTAALEQLIRRQSRSRGGPSL